MFKGLRDPGVTALIIMGRSFFIESRRPATPYVTQWLRKREVNSERGVIFRKLYTLLVGISEKRRPI